MRESIYKNYDELPLFLNANMVAGLLGVSPSSAYELMHEKDFPSLRIGNRLLVPKDQFQIWVEGRMHRCVTDGTVPGISFRCHRRYLTWE